MGVLIEGISVVVKRSVIEERYPGGLDQFCLDIPNDTYCADENLVRVGFMHPDDVAAFCEHLKTFGIHYVVNGTAEDLVVIDQQRGCMSPCGWVELWNVYRDPEVTPATPKVLVCTVIGGVWIEFQEPVGWTWEGSLSESFAFAQTEDVDKSFTYLGEEENVEVYRNELTGRPAFVGRTRPNNPHDPEDKSMFIVD